MCAEGLMDGFWSSRIGFDVDCRNTSSDRSGGREIGSVTRIERQSRLTLFLKGTYFGHKPFGFQSLSYVIHGWDVS